MTTIKMFHIKNILTFSQFISNKQSFIGIIINVLQVFKLFSSNNLSLYFV